jgi:predicted RNA-binding protein with TRAM domain
MELIWLAAAGGAVVGVALVVVLLRRGSADGAASKRAHEQAQKREPPVELGETYDVGVIEFSDHHSGERVAVGKVEGFVLFTEGIPDTLTEGDLIRVRVLSFNRNRTSADATYVETV